jgi:hypothetical protein
MKQVIEHLLEGLNLEETLTDDKMCRMIRFLLALEDETFQLYIHLMNSTDNSRISTVFKDIAEMRMIKMAATDKIAVQSLDSLPCRLMERTDAD